MNYYLGIDGGGTKTKFVMADELGHETEIIKVGPTSLVAVSQQQAQTNLELGLEKICSHLNEDDKEDDRVMMAVMGLASVDSDIEEEQAAKIFQPIFSKFPVEQFAVLNDVVPALVNSTEQDNAIVLIAGTGSNCYGENDQGETAKAGGLDYLLTDQGSGYDIGLKVLRAAAKSYDGRGPKTILEEKLLKHFHVSEFVELKQKIYNPNLNKKQVAALAELLVEALAEKDEVAQMILEWESNELWLMVETVADELELREKKFELVLEGSVVQMPQMIKRLSKNLNAYSPSASLVLPKRSAVYGALKLAKGD